MNLHFVLLERFVVKLANIEVITNIEDAAEGECQSQVWLLSGQSLTLEMTRDEALDAVSRACATVDAQDIGAIPRDRYWGSPGAAVRGEGARALHQVRQILNG